MKRLLPLILTAGIFGFFPQIVTAQTVALAKEWDKAFGGVSEEELFALKPTADGGYMLGGWSNSGISGDKSQAASGATDYWIVKLASDGSRQWDKTIGGPGQDQLFSLQQTSDGGYILGGESSSGVGGDKSYPGRGNDDFWVVKLDANGNKIWDRSFGGVNSERLFALQQTTDGGYILGGVSDSWASGDISQPNRGLLDYWVVKIDANGNKIWDKTFGGSAHDYLHAVQQTADGGYLLGGYSASGIGGDKIQDVNGARDMWLVKIDGNGKKEWDKTIGGTFEDDLFSFQQTPDGGYILLGSSQSDIGGDKSQPSKGSYDFWLVKTDGLGNKIWDRTLGGDGLDAGEVVRQTTDGGYLLGGYSTSEIGGDKTQPAGRTDYWIVKVDANGDKIWDRTLGGSNDDKLYCLELTPDGGFIAGGQSYSPTSNDKSALPKGLSDYWVLKFGTKATEPEPEPEKPVEPATPQEITIGPNPNNGEFLLKMQNLNVPVVQVVVYNLYGKAVKRQTIPVSQEEISEQIILPSAKGLFLVQINAGEKVITRKIIVK